MSGERETNAAKEFLEHWRYELLYESQKATLLHAAEPVMGNTHIAKKLTDLLALLSRTPAGAEKRGQLLSEEQVFKLLSEVGTVDEYFQPNGNVVNRKWLLTTWEAKKLVVCLNAALAVPQEWTCICEQTAMGSPIYNPQCMVHGADPAGLEKEGAK